MTNLIYDLRHAVRVLAKSPGFAAIVVVTLALGIGANVTLFAYLSYFLWPTLEAPEPERLVWIFNRTPEDSERYVSYPDFRDVEPELRAAFSQLTAYRIFGASLKTAERTLHTWGTAVDGDFFALFDVRPALGRLLSTEDDRRGAPIAVVLSHGFWQRHFGGDPAVLGHAAELDGHHAATIVGVAPPGFQGGGIGTGIFVPMVHAGSMISPRGLDGVEPFILGRFADGVSPARVEALLGNLGLGLDAARALDEPRELYGKPVTDRSAWVEGDLLVETTRVLTAAVVLLLVLACANVANLMLARATARRREMAIHAALGANRGRLARRLLFESLLLATAGGVAGLVLARRALEVIESYLIRTVPVGMGEWGKDTSLIVNFELVGTFFVLATAGTALFFGAVPILQLWRQDLVTALKSETAASTGTRRRIGARQLLVVAQVAISVVLLTGAGLLGHTLLELRGQELGFAAEGRVLATVYRPREHAGDAKALYRDLEARTRELPGVVAASLASHLPASFPPDEKYEIAASGEIHAASHNVVSPTYFETLGIPFVQGRDFTTQDHDGAAGVVIVNQTAARSFWPDGSTLGETLRLAAGRDGVSGTYEVVGVVADSRHASPSRPHGPHVYFAFEQRFRPRMTLLVHATSAMARPLHDLLRERYPELALLDLQPMAEQVRRAVADQRMNSDFALGFALLGLLLAALGIYSVMSYVTRRRTREIGIRMAVGADRGRIGRWVLGETGRLVALGIGVGWIAAWFLARVFKGLLFGVEIHDPWVFTAVPAVLALVGLLAAVPPARRASGVDPIRALHEE